MNKENGLGARKETKKGREGSKEEEEEEEGTG